MSEALVRTFLKFIHVMILWIIVYFMSRAYEAHYTQNVLIHDKENSNLYTFTLSAVIVDAAIYLVLIGTILGFLYITFKTDSNSYIIDKTFLYSFVTSYILFAVLLIVIGTAYAAIITNKHRFHFKTDGLRGIRALSTLVFFTGVVLIALTI